MNTILKKVGTRIVLGGSLLVAGTNPVWAAGFRMPTSRPNFSSYHAPSFSSSHMSTPSFHSYHAPSFSSPRMNTSSFHSYHAPSYSAPRITPIHTAYRPPTYNHAPAPYHYSPPAPVYRPSHVAPPSRPWVGASTLPRVPAPVVTRPLTYTPAPVYRPIVGRAVPQAPVFSATPIVNRPVVLPVSTAYNPIPAYVPTTTTIPAPIATPSPVVSMPVPSVASPVMPPPLTGSLAVAGLTDGLSPDFVRLLQPSLDAPSSDPGTIDPSIFMPDASSDDAATPDQPDTYIPAPLEDASTTPSHDPGTSDSTPTPSHAAPDSSMEDANPGV